MNDDELIDRLRRTLRREAAAIAPGPDGQPAPEYHSPARLRLLRRGWPVALVAAAAAAGVALAVINWPGGGSSHRGGVAGAERGDRNHRARAHWVDAGAGGRPALQRQHADDDPGRSFDSYQPRPDGHDRGAGGERLVSFVSA